MDNKMEFDVVFKGEIVKGFSTEEVKNSLGTAFKLPPDKIDRLFTGKSVPLKRSLSSEKAIGLQRNLLKMGVVCHLIPIVIESQIINKPTMATLPLSLEPINPRHHQYADNADNKDKSDSDSETDDVKRFELPHINIIAILLLLVGLALAIIFSPYPDMVVRKGFVLGVVFVFFGIRKIKQ